MWSSCFGLPECSGTMKKQNHLQSLTGPKQSHEFLGTLPTWGFPKAELGASFVPVLPRMTLVLTQSSSEDTPGLVAQGGLVAIERSLIVNQHWCGGHAPRHAPWRISINSVFRVLLSCHLKFILLKEYMRCICSTWQNVFTLKLNHSVILDAHVSQHFESFCATFKGFCCHISLASPQSSVLLSYA